jgi:hypothetical protein
MARGPSLDLGRGSSRGTASRVRVRVKSPLITKYILKLTSKKFDEFNRGVLRRSTEVPTIQSWRALKFFNTDARCRT